MADRQHRGTGTMRQRGGVKARGSALTVAIVAASLGAGSPALARTTCAELNCTVETSSTSSTSSSSTTSTSASTTTTAEVWNTILTGPSRPSSPGSQPVVMTEAQRKAQRVADIRQNWYGEQAPRGCGQMPMVVCPEPDPAAPTVQQVGTTNTTTNTTTTRRTTVSVQELAVRAKAKIRLAKPDIGSAPCAGAGCQGAVGIPVWLWTQALPTQSESASAGGRTVSVSDKVTKVTWDLGNGTTITCNGSGTAYNPSMGWATSPDCGVPNGYTKAGRYTVTATFHHEVTYTGVNLPAEAVTSTASTDVTIGEVQAIGVTARG